MIVVIAMFSCCRNYSSCLISQSKENWLYPFSFSIRRHYRVWQHPWGLHLYQRFVGAWSERPTYSSRSPSILVFTICTLFRIRNTLREWCCQKTTCWCWSVLLFFFQFFNSLSFVISYLCIIYFSFFFLVSYSLYPNFDICKKECIHIMAFLKSIFTNKMRLPAVVSVVFAILIFLSVLGFWRDIRLSSIKF